MLTDLDVSRSLAGNKVHFRLSLLEKGFVLFCKALLVCFFPAFALSYIYEYPDTFSTDLFGSVMGLIVTFGLGYFIFIWVRRPTRLVQIEGTSAAENRKKVLKVLEKMGWQIGVDHENYLIAIQRGLPERQITVLYSGNTILLSAVNLGRFESIMTYYRKGIERFSNEFQNIQ